MMTGETWQLGYPCENRLYERQVGAWVTGAGDYRTTQHVLESRHFGEALLIYCLEGGGQFTLGGSRHAVGAGDLFFLPPYVTHGYRCDPVAGWRILWLHFGGAYAESLVRLAGFSVANPLRHLGERPAVAAAIERLLTILREQKYQHGVDAAGALVLLLLELVKLGEPDQPERRRLLEAAEKGGSLDAMARRAGCSKYHFARLFHAQVGLPPWRYVLNRRVEQARGLLLNPHFTVKEIAGQLGFRDGNDFTRCFTRLTGLSPRRYRESIAVRTAPVPEKPWHPPSSRRLRMERG